MSYKNRLSRLEKEWSKGVCPCCGQVDQKRVKELTDEELEEEIAILEEKLGIK